METEIITSNEELRQMIKDGYFFNFCVGFALNKGFRDAIKDKKEVSFMVGDYEVKFVPDSIHFQLCHKIYFARIIHAYYQGAQFIGNDEEEVIAELLAEFDKETDRQ
jgi:basic membrane lipoprotein Med (substrate-binding protein (PBP1-ABC) superfamily)